MSLDVYLYRERMTSYDKEKTFVNDLKCVYDSNITHNLGTLAQKANLYDALWRPYLLHKEFDPKWLDDNELECAFEGQYIVYAKDIIPSIEEGLKDLKRKPEYFEQFNSPNGRGMYENFVPFVEKYLTACKEYPEAIVKVSR